MPATRRLTALWPIFMLSMALAVGCAHYQAAEEAPAEVGNRQRDVITHDEIMASPHRLVDLYQAVRGLRPHFLFPNVGTRTRNYPVSVYVDGVRQQNGIQVLATIPASSVERVDYLDPGRAESQYGSIANGGAVMVTMAGQFRSPASARDTMDVR